MDINCLYDKLVPIVDIKMHPRNRNVHPDDQIDRLAKILKYQGWRYPVKVSKLSGYVTSGHGRIMAARKNGWHEVPVNFQDYANEDQEASDLIADNTIAMWSQVDYAGINFDLANFDPSFDLDMLGIKDFKVDVAEKDEAEKEKCPECGQEV